MRGTIARTIQPGAIQTGAIQTGAIQTGAIQTGAARWTWLVLATWLMVAGARLSAGAPPVDFHREVAPLLVRHCLRCHHGPAARGALSLQRRGDLLRGGESGPAIVPGDPAASLLIDQIAPTDGAAAMPQGEPPLAAGAIQTIRRWIAQGAEWPADVSLQPPGLWSLQPLVRPPLPSEGQMADRSTPDGGTTDSATAGNPIDAFIAQRRRQATLRAAPEADRRTLIRRLCLDLTGLPPSPREVQAFLSDEAPDAYQRLVDRLLASPHFGERWGRHWLDLARYGDSDGYLGDSERPHAWLYREWVIEAINRDLPFDQFSIDQLAGDLLEQPSPSQRIATGFHRNTLRNTEAGVDRELYRTQEVVDRVNTTGMVWLGLTLGCAECHDHKNDPVTQVEFYRLYAFFNNADDADVPVRPSWQRARYERSLGGWRAEWQELVDRLQAFQLDELTETQQAAIAAAVRDDGRGFDWSAIASSYRSGSTEWDQLQQQIDRQLQTRPVPPTAKAPALHERRQDRRETFVHERGVYTRRGPRVHPGTPAALPMLSPRGESPDRLDLARWLFHPANPLAARVAANRIWQHLFGQGLVATPNDFGNAGERPTHPQLLDWLACEYRRLGWSRKALIRTIVSSAAYRLASAANAVPPQQHLDNHLLWRQNSVRIEAEIVRDLHLAASGLLDRTIGRAGIYPPLPDFVTEVGRSVKWPESTGGERYRRGLYIFFKRTVPYPMLMTFDAPDATVSCSRRERSNTPLQALTVLNDPVLYECASSLGRELLRRHGEDTTAALDELFQRCLARPPLAAERSALLNAHEDLLRMAARAAPPPARPGTAADAEPAADTDPAADLNPAVDAMVALARIVMNLDEFITRD